MEQNEEIRYKIEPDGTAKIRGIYPNGNGDVYVPSFVIHDGARYSVSSILFGKFDGVPGVDNIRKEVIANRIYIPGNIKFRIFNSHITEIHILGDIDELDGISDRCTSLQKVIVHGAVKRIPYFALRNCHALKEIIIEQDCHIEINCSAFANCSNLEQILVGGQPITLEHTSNTFCLSAFCGCTNYKFYRGRIILEDGLLLSPDRKILYAIVGRQNDSGHYAIPDTVCELLHDMSYAKLRTIDFSQCSIKEIDADTFRECVSLESVILPNNNIVIGDRAFWGCSNLKHVENFNNITKFGIASFHHSGIRSCVISRDVTEIPKSVFLGCVNLEEIVIPSSVNTINSNVFEDCPNIKRVKISIGFRDSLGVLFKDANDVQFEFFDNSATNYHRPSGAYTHGNLSCPYCGSDNRTTYIDGTAECHNCGGEYRYW